MLNVIITILFILALILNVILLARLKLDLKKPDGLLNVDTRDPDKDYYDFVFLIPTGDIPKKKFLTIEVKTKS